MPRLTRALPLAAVVLAVVPAAAQAKLLRAHRLVSVAPRTTVFADRILAHAAASSPAARAAQSPTDFRAYAAADGNEVRVALSAQYAADPAVAQSYVDFLASLPHGAELSRLRVYIAPPGEVLADCGGVEGTLACYTSSDHLMIVPGEQPAQDTGVTVSYVVTHEYGHHVATYRDNAPFSSLAYGPKYWASYERVCARSFGGELFPGDEGSHYTANPGENWAETYARLKYPEQPWTFAPFMAPDAGALAAAQRDVAAPWGKRIVHTFRGRLRAHGARTRRFALPLRLDGSVTVILRGPRRANYNVRVFSGRHTLGTTKRRGSRDAITFRALCRQTSGAETLRIAVRRVTGAGPFRVIVKYAG
jgi:hypothetical protein